MLTPLYEYRYYLPYQYRFLRKELQLIGTFYTNPYVLNKGTGVAAPVAAEGKVHVV